MTYDRNAPLYGATRAQVIAQGLNPDDVEEGRLASREIGQKEALAQETEAAAAALQAVADGLVTWSEAATALNAAGFHDAHEVVVEQWRADENWYQQQDVLDEMSSLDAESYLERHAAQIEREREAAALEVERQGTELAQAKYAQLRAQFDRYVTETPGAHAHADAVRERLDQLVVDEDAGEGLAAIPDTPEQQARMVEQALHDVALRDGISANLTEKVNADWRASESRRKSEQFTTRRSDDRNLAQRARDEADWKNNRLEELKGSLTIDPGAARNLGPTAEEQSAALVDKYAERQAKSTSFHAQVAGIAARGADATAARDRGENMSAQRKSYKDAYARAEANAAYGAVRTHMTEGAEASAKTGHGPDGSWPDELGPAL